MAHSGSVRKMLLVDPVGPLKQYSSRLDKEMNEILYDSKLSDDEKLRRYLHVLRRFILSQRSSVEHPLTTSDPSKSIISDKGEKEVDKEVEKEKEIEIEEEEDFTIPGKRKRTADQLLVPPPPVKK